MRFLGGARGRIRLTSQDSLSKIGEKKYGPWLLVVVSKLEKSNWKFRGVEKNLLNLWVNHFLSTFNIRFTDFAMILVEEVLETKTKNVKNVNLSKIQMQIFTFWVAFERLSNGMNIYITII